MAYSGHGSRIPAHPAFWQQSPDKQHKTLVAWDSREEGGRDLLDKELSWLVWQATKDKEVHFLVLMDCCFSGSNLRMEGMRDRMAPALEQSGIPAPETLLGFPDYHKIGEGQWGAPRGRYLQLTASRADQPAREMQFQEGTHGVFTYYLLKELIATNRPFTYGELYQRVYAAVNSRISRQGPQMDYTIPDFPKQLFLRQEKQETASKYWVYFQQSSRSWVVNAGSINGIQVDQKPRSIVKVDSGKVSLPLKEVKATFSIVEPAPEMDQQCIYPATVDHLLVRQQYVAFAPGFPEALKADITSTFAEEKPAFTQLIDNPAAADYWIEIEDEELLSLRPKGNEASKFKTSAFKESKKLWQDADQIGRRDWVSNLNNPQTEFEHDSLRIELFQFETAARYTEDSLKYSIHWPEVLHLQYAFVEGRWCYPAFQCKLTNTTPHSVWVSALFLGNDYSISNALLPKNQLAPGGSVWLSHHWNEEQSTIIRNGIEPRLLEAGVSSNAESIKILVSTDELFTDMYNQTGLIPDRYRAGKGLLARAGEKCTKSSRSDWTSYDIYLVTYLEYAKVQGKHQFL